MEDKPARSAYTRESQRIEEDALYSAKGHFEAARTWSRIHLWIGLPTAILAAVSGVSAFKDETVIAGALAKRSNAE